MTLVNTAFYTVCKGDIVFVVDGKAMNRIVVTSLFRRGGDSSSYILFNVPWQDKIF